MAEIWFTATKKFDPQNAPGWPEYIEWSGLHQLRRVLTLDITLCPPAIEELIPEDWRYNVQEDFRILYFRDFEYLIRRLPPDRKMFNILAILLEPMTVAGGIFSDDRFLLRGYDLVERETGISALTNCKGFESAFKGNDLSTDGLIVDFQAARLAQSRLRERYPDEHHADCELWAIWEKNDDG